MKQFIRFGFRPYTIVLALVLVIVCLGYTWFLISRREIPDAIVFTSAYLTSATLAYVLVTVASSWVGTQEKKQNLQLLSQLSTSAIYRDRLARVTGLAVAAFCGYVIGAIFLAIIFASTENTYGAFSWQAIIATALMVAVHAPLGYLFGLMLPFTATPSILSFLVFVTNSVLGNVYGAPFTLFIASAQIDPSVFVKWNGSVFSAQILWFLAVLFFITFIASTRFEKPRRLVIVAVPSMFLALIGAVLLVPFEGKRFSPEQAAFVPICKNTKPELCVHPSFQRIQPQLHQTFSALMVKVSGTPLAADRFEMRPRGIGQDPSPGAVAFHTDFGDKRGAYAARQEYIESSLDDSCFTVEGMSAQPWQTIVNQWLIDDLENPVFDNDWKESVPGTERQKSREWFSKLTETQRSVWFQEHWNEFSQCTLNSEDFA